MKFTLHRKPDSKAQKIPFPAMQIAGLADAEALVLRAEEGCILLARDSLSTREIVKVIASWMRSSRPWRNNWRKKATRWPACKRKMIL